MDPQVRDARVFVAVAPNDGFAARVVMHTRPLDVGSTDAARDAADEAETSRPPRAARRTVTLLDAAVVACDEPVDGPAWPVSRHAFWRDFAAKTFGATCAALLGEARAADAPATAPAALLARLLVEIARNASTPRSVRRTTHLEESTRRSGSSSSCVRVAEEEE
mmetsp:Transcript_13246/g.53104  ORF Transcript_13246/g.53104 Transcript_13246/m.53104 type:complete len:164 (-) Transcript_13246:338-829(-)